MAVAALVLGIVSVVFSFTGPIAFIGIIAGVVGIVLAVMAKKKEPSGVATGGLITSIVGTALSAIMFIACYACLAGGGAILNEAAKELEKDPKKLEQSLKSLENFGRELQKEAEKAKTQ